MFACFLLDFNKPVVVVAYNIDIWYNDFMAIGKDYLLCFGVHFI